MLGEDHSLTKDFPDYTQTIAKLNANDENFATKAKQSNIMKSIKKFEYLSYKTHP